MYKFAITKTQNITVLLALESVILALMASLLNLGSTVPISAAAAVSKFTVSGYPSPIQAGMVGNLSVTALDVSGNTINDYTGTIHFTSNSQAVLPADYTFTTSDKGTHMFTNVILKTAGSQSIIVTDKGTGITGTQSNITVTAAAATEVRAETSYNGSGAIIPAQNVELESSINGYAITWDAYGNFVANVAGIWSLTNISGGVESGDLVPSSDQKSAVFTGHLPGSANIHVTSGSLTSVDSGTITITAATAKTLFLSNTSNIIANISASYPYSLNVTAKDAYNNTATGYTGTIQFTSTDTEAALPANYTFTSTDKGTHTFIVTLNTPGTQSITATDTIIHSITGSLNGITVIMPAPSSLPDQIDNSASPAFPPVGKQTAGESSCVAWATTYYQFTYENARERGLNASGGDQNVIFSPKWTYTMINGGSNSDTTLSNAYALLMKNGAASWAVFPYDGVDYRGWCLNPVSWRAAINNRAASTGTIPAPKQSDGTVDCPDFITALKTQLNSGHIIVVVTYEQSWITGKVGNDPAGSFEDNKFAGQTIATYMANTQHFLHTLTLVGYNDAIWVDLNGNSKVDPVKKAPLKWSIPVGRIGKMTDLCGLVMMPLGRPRE